MFPLVLTMLEPYSTQTGIDSDFLHLRDPSYIERNVGFTTATFNKLIRNQQFLDRVATIFSNC